jgi:hypothetical protein
VYGALVVYGFTVWLKASRERQVPTVTDPSLETVGG